MIEEINTSGETHHHIGVDELIASLTQMYESSDSSLYIWATLRGRVILIEFSSDEHGDENATSVIFIDDLPSSVCTEILINQINHISQQ